MEPKPCPGGLCVEPHLYISQKPPFFRHAFQEVAVRAVSVRGSSSLAVAEDHPLDRWPAAPCVRRPRQVVDKGQLRARKSKMAGLRMLAMMPFLVKQPAESCSTLRGVMGTYRISAKAHL